MRKIIVLLVNLLLVTAVTGQTDSLQAPYKKYPFFPPVKLLLPDSSSFFTKNDLPRKKPVMVMLFNPQCEHCRHETEELVRHIDKFKDIHIVMSTSMPFDSMMVFRSTYKLAQFDNIVVAQDPGFFLPTYYMVRHLPFLAFYNRDKELISAFEGSLPIPAILELFKKKRE